MQYYVRFYPTGDEDTPHTIFFTTEEARSRYIAANRGFWEHHSVFER